MCSAASIAVGCVAWVAIPLVLPPNRLDGRNERLPAMLSAVIEESHKPEIHMELLVAVEEGQTRVVGNEIHFRFLVAAEH